MPHPLRRWASAAAAVALAVTALLGAASSASAADAAFQAWLRSLWPEAEQLGVSRATFDAATRGLEPDLSLPDLVIPGRPDAPPRGQAEFVQTPADYLREATLASLAAQGRKLLDQHRATLLRIEREFGVPPHVVLAIWGRETAFGGYKLPHSAIRVLATQGFYGRRKDLFRNEFLMALKMLEEGHVTLADMRSSWGGAMGLTQFLPSEFYKQGVDFDGDGRRDIWRSVPDALASAAKQLADKGWQPGKHWAYEVRAAAGLDCTIANPDSTLTLGEWLQRGFAPARSRKIDAAELGEKASLLMPAGVYGPAFLILKNYYVIKDYNFSDLYVLFVGNVSDRIAGGSAFEKPWGKVVQLRSKELEEMQQRLTALGLYRDKIDGKAGMRTRLALGAYQKANGLTLDCWPSADVLAHMRTRTARN
ncbi:MAG: lytic murein transglycosylase [Rhodoplanes sp.]